MKRLASIVLAAWSAGAPAQEEHPGPAPAPGETSLEWVAVDTAPEPELDEAFARRLFELRCAVCHGERGRGDGPAARHLVPPPRDFTSGVFKFRSTRSGELPTDGDLRRVIREGVPGTAMPPWPGLDERELSHLVAWVKRFSPRFAQEPPRERLAAGEEPPLTPELLARGRALYTEMACVQCHGERGDGDGPVVALPRDEAEPPLQPPRFRHGRFRSGPTARDLFRALATGLDGSPMPSFGESFSRDDLWALTAWVWALGDRSHPAAWSRSGGAGEP